MNKTLITLCLYILSCAFHLIAGINFFPGDPGFETRNTSFFYSMATRTPEINTEDAHSGIQSLEFSGKYMLSRWIFIPVERGESYVLSFYAKGTAGTEFECSIWSGWASLGRLKGKITPEWTRFELPIVKSTRDNIWLMFRKTDEGNNILLDDFQLEKGNKATTYQPPASVVADITTGAPAEMVELSPDGKVKLDLTIYNAELPAGTEVEIDVEVRRFPETTALIHKTLATVLKSKECFQKEMDLPEVNCPGYYPVLVTVKTGNQVLNRLEAPFIVVPPLPEIDGIQDFFGIHPHVVDLRALSLMGAGWVRCGVADWRTVEPQKGNFQPISSVSIFHQNGFKVLGALTGMNNPPQWVTKQNKLPCKGEEIEGFVRYVVDQTGADIDCFETQNEPDLTLAAGMGVPLDQAADCFSSMFSSVGKVLKESEHPLQFHVSGGAEGMTKFADQVFQKAGDAFQVYAPHTYSSPRYIGPDKSFVATPEEGKLRETLSAAAAMIRKYGMGQELWVGEYGFALDFRVPCDSHWAMLHAAYTVRAYLIAQTVPEMKRIFSFTDYYTVEGKYYDYGFWRADLHPTPAAAAYATCVRMTGASECIPHKLGKEVNIIEFRRGERSVVAVWNADLKSERNALPCSLNFPDASGCSMTGSPLLSRDGKLVFTLTPAPVYFEMNKSQVSKFVDCFLVSLARQQPLQIEVSRPARQELIFQISAAPGSTKTWKGEVILEIASERLVREVEVHPNTPVNLQIQWEKPLPSTNFDVEIFARADGSAEHSMHVVRQLGKLIPALRLEEKDWKNFDFQNHPQTLILEKRTDIQPPDPGIGWKGGADLSGRIFFGWDNQNFYIMARVCDDIHCQTFSGKDIWRGDSLQLGFDFGHDAVSSGLGYDNKNDYEFGFALTHEGKTTVWCWQFPEKESRAMDIPCLINRKDGITEYRCAFPWNMFNVTPKAGQLIGISCAVNDDDGNGVNFYLGTDTGLVGMKRPERFSELILENEQSFKTQEGISRLTH